MRSFPLEVAVVAHFDVNYQVTMGTSFASMAFFRYSQVHSIIDTLWYVDRFFYCTVHRTTATTGNTRISNDLAGTIAVATDLLNHERPLSDGLKALATAGTAS